MFMTHLEAAPDPAVLPGRMGWLRPHRKSPELPNTWRAAKWQGWVWNFPNGLPSRLSPESGGPGKDELTQGLSYTSLWTATSAGAPSKSLTWKTCLRALGPRACLPCTIGAKEWRPKLAQLQPRPQTRTSNMASPLRQTWPEPALGAVSGAAGQVDSQRQGWKLEAYKGVLKGNTKPWTRAAVMG